MSNRQKETSLSHLKAALEKENQSEELGITIELLDELYDEFLNRTITPDRNPTQGIERILDKHNGNK